MWLLSDDLRYSVPNRMVKILPHVLENEWAYMVLRMNYSNDLYFLPHCQKLLTPSGVHGRDKKCPLSFPLSDTHSIIQNCLKQLALFLALFS